MSLVCPLATLVFEIHIREELKQADKRARSSNPRERRKANCVSKSIKCAAKPSLGNTEGFIMDTASWVT